jgi:hypothetical protein
MPLCTVMIVAPGYFGLTALTSHLPPSSLTPGTSPFVNSTPGGFECQADGGFKCARVIGASPSAHSARWIVEMGSRAFVANSEMRQPTSRRACLI